MSFVCAFCVAAAVASPAQNFTTLYRFTDGSIPVTGLIQDADGNLYGTTDGGGVNSALCFGFFGCGTVYKITPTGTLTVLYNFCSQSNCADGYDPQAALVQGVDGNFYGTTANGGANKFGTVFKITPSGTLTTLHSFNGTDGSVPVGALIMATDKNLYGTTSSGGTSGDGGTVFKITPSGTLTTLYNFCSQSNCADGLSPSAGLVQGVDEGFYGTTAGGGVNNNTLCFGLGCGTVFKITPSGTLTTLYNFCSQSNCADGFLPVVALIQGPDGNLYGTTAVGGASADCSNNGNTDGCGTIFEITPTGTLTTFYNFCQDSGCTDGIGPEAALLLGTDGSFYGTAIGGGVEGFGMVFRITPSGVLTKLHSFCSQRNCTDGKNIHAGLMQDTNGAFYGAAYLGGIAEDGGYGTVFSVSVGLGPFVETQPTFGKVGATVTILGTNLTGATNVTFNGTSAALFTVNSTGTAITTTVPTGAATGKVQVVIPHGTLSSNVPFRVRP